jgi:hypothetical protein
MVVTGGWAAPGIAEITSLAGAKPADPKAQPATVYTTTPNRDAEDHGR